MESKEAKRVIAYYAAIPEMLKLLRQEKDDLDLKYSCAKGIAIGEMQHSNNTSRPTEKIAIRIAETGTRDRIKEIEVQIQVLERDAALIRGCLDGLNAKYKRILLLRYVKEYSWAKISVGTGKPESTIRAWGRKATARMGQELEEVPMIEEILYRASRAR